MSRYRGGPSFDDLWERRTTIEVDGEPVDLLALEDLVDAKKTQRDKDWPMIGRLLQTNYFEYADRNPAPALVAFWMREIRSPELLREIAVGHPDIARAIASERTAVASALAGDNAATAAAIQAEEAEERRRDREYWQPLRRELEQFRHERLRSKPPTIS